ncbi:hypothetical protein D2V05_13025 [Flagellimonas pelagia]|uniref:Uncharacterized protein n=1 Tax=Flagellimonas pelagia TaxID=2306998 RepID=A0A3A1NI46_9FLAO|nr:hypothetical protein D2V05_13025 [Allomuricauda maritima]
MLHIFYIFLIFNDLYPHIFAFQLRLKIISWVQIINKDLEFPFYTIYQVVSLKTLIFIMFWASISR